MGRERRIATVILVAGTLVLAQLAAAGGSSTSVRNLLDPDGAAASKITEAHQMLMSGQMLDMTRFAVLLSDAHKLSPALDKRNAAEWRRCAIRCVGLVPRANCSELVNTAVMLDHGLAFDDTLVRIGNLLGPPTEMMRVWVARQAKAKPSAGETPVVVAYKPLPEGALKPLDSPNLSNRISGTDPSHFPRVLRRTAVADPRGSGAAHEVVTVSAIIGVDGRVQEVKDAVGSEELKAAAKEAVRGWTYAPMTVFGRPVEVTAEIPVEFGGSDPPPSGSAQGSTDALPKFGEYVFVEVLPEAIEHPAPEYPAAAKQSGVSGTVMVQALVDKDGHVVDTRVVKSIPELDAAAVATAKHWVFKPATAGGKPVAVWVAVPMKFPAQ